MTEEQNPVDEISASGGVTDSAPDIEGVEVEVHTHAEHVRDQALRLFDHTRPWHELADESRRVLEIAALIYNVPFPPGKKKPINAARKLIQAQVYEEPLSNDQQAVLAAVLALQHGQIKRKAIGQLGLSPIQQREALTLAALLRIAIGLDQSGSQQTCVEQVELARNELWIVISGPNVEADVAAAQHNARLWSKIGYPDVQILLPAEAKARLMPYPEPQETTGILSEDSFAEAGRKVMRYHFAEMLRQESGTRLGEDIEALHDMRVATRRLRAAFDVFGAAFERQEMRRHRAGLRATGQALGQVRDLDVMIEKAQSYRDRLPEEQRAGMEPLFDFWKSERESARQKMLAYLDSREFQDFKREFNVFVCTPGSGVRPIPDNPPEPSLVSEIAPILIFTRLAVVRAYEPYLPDAPVERLHALRIEFKKLRYTVEFFREVLGEDAKMAINKFKKIQDHLGDLNDAQVVGQILEQFMGEWQHAQEQLPESERRDAHAIEAYRESRLAEKEMLIASFQDVWDDFNQPAFRHRLAQAIAVL